MGRQRDNCARKAGFVAALAAVCTWSIPAPEAVAKVNPLVVLQRQIHKANVLIMLDTSGSMTGVPGGVFSYSAEAGVDCDNGLNCRKGGVSGVCAVSARSCLSDEDCRRGYCELDETRPCQTDVDCPTDPPTCSVTKTACATDSDCPAQSGKCATTGAACTVNGDCAAVGKCKYGNTVCNNPGGNCPDIGTCQQASETTCMDKVDCPQASSGGNCANGGTPPSGCSTQEDCPSQSKCQYTDETCRGTTECPVDVGKGRCALSGKTCVNDNQCDKGVSEKCVYWSNPCVGPPNPCTMPHTPCQMHTDNACTAVSNNCVTPANTCTTAVPNKCVPPASLTDTCNPGAKGTPGPIRMCRIAQTVCTQNSHCTAAGDSCGPATSRMVVAKRSINSVVTKNYDIVNFGFMTFWQNGYYPYYEVTAGGTTGTVTEFQSKDKLVAASCFDTGWGPSPSCSISGVKMTLRATVNSRYTVRTGPTSYLDVDQNWCGTFCDIKPSVGSGEYQGSYYQYDGASGGNSTNKIVKQTYQGKNITEGGINYTYYQALPNYYNGGATPPFGFTNCEVTNACGAQCGARWDETLSPFLDTSDDPVTAKNNALSIAERLEYASYGGLMAFWSTPIGCALENSGASNVNASAYHYMDAVKNGNLAAGVSKDPVDCRENYVLLITDGAANGPGDVDSNGVSLCTDTKCSQSDPLAAGCQCRSVLAAYNMRKNLGVKTFVVGFSGDVAAGDPRVINDNIARAGGTDSGNDGVAPFALITQNEDELVSALQSAIYEAVRGSYSTAPTSSSAGTQQSVTLTEGKYGLDSRMDFPSWKGHLLAYDLSADPPTLSWDAATKLAEMNWWERRVYTWDGTQMIRIAVDATSKDVINKDKLHSMGLGNTPDEAQNVARWLLGDPSFKNPAVLGSIINSTPIDVASPGNIPLPGGNEFFNKYKDRPHLVYVGSDNGLLHAFFLETTTVGGKTYAAGTEAFAFLAPDMVTTVKNLYTQGGQKADPSEHIFGLAQSAKVKSMCVSGCADKTTAVWKTVLIMPEGYGGNDTFMLDITDPFDTTVGIKDPPLDVEWHTGYVASGGAATYDSALGLTISVPAFFFNKTAAMDDNRVIFASGYATSSNPADKNQGRSLVMASAVTGAVLGNAPVTVVGNCAQDYTLLTDVATARDFGKDQYYKLLTGYVGDTWGNLWRYTTTNGLQLVTSFGCSHPLHFSPTVVQLDRDDPENHAKEIYPVQVTNSSLDLVTGAYSASKMVIMKEIAEVDETTGAVKSISPDTTFGNAGQVVLNAGVANEICAEMTAEGACTTPMPTDARPTATPMGILRKDGSGFQTITLWYQASPNGCSKGTTYFTIHEMANGGVTQKQGFKVANEPVTSPVIVGGRIFVFGSDGAIEITKLITEAYVSGQATAPHPYEGTFSQLTWIEKLD